MNISYSFDDGGENPRVASFTNNGEWWLGNENDDDVIFE